MMELCNCYIGIGKKVTKHNEVCYAEGDCPVCEALQQLEEKQNELEEMTKLLAEKQKEIEEAVQDLVDRQEAWAERETELDKEIEALKQELTEGDPKVLNRSW